MWAVEVWNRYLAWAPHYLPAILGGALFGVGLVLVSRRRPESRTRLAMGTTGVALGLGLWQAWVRMSVVDDAFISLRYAKNLLAGRGFVYNEGEYVLGITNFGWTLVMATLGALTRLELPHVALLMGVCGYVALVVAAHRTSRAMHGDAIPPLAALGVALSWLTHSFATTGLESLSIVALVVLGMERVVRGHWRLAGLFLTLAAVFRLDQGLFLAIGGLLALRDGKLREYLTWTLLLAAALVFCTWYYGSPIPNSALNKTSSGAYWSHGSFYIWTFFLTTHLLWLLPLALLGVMKATEAPERRGVWFALAGLVAWPTYIAYVGGDFMLGRFLLVLIPFVYLLAEVGVRHLGGLRQLTAAVALGATFYGMPLIHRKTVEWWLTDEGSIYEVKTLVPFEMKHHTYTVGRFLHEAFVQRGFRPTIAAHGIGMIGYYSDLPLVDIIGLTDPVTATIPLEKRGRPGHERYASRAHLQSTGALLTSLPPYPNQRDITRLHVPGALKKKMSHWHLLRYAPEEVAQLRATVPEIRFLNIEDWLDTFIGALDKKPTALIRSRLQLLDGYYFSQPGAKTALRARLVAELHAREEQDRLAAIGYVAGEDVATAEGGVVLHLPLAGAGLNLVASAHGPEAVLLAMDGAVVHRWRLPFAEAFPGSARPPGTGGTTWRRVEALPDGDLLAIFEGQGIVRVNRDSKVVWARKNRAHHDIELTEEGTLWTLTRGTRRQSPLGRPLIEDFAVELDLATGNEIRRISLLDAALASPSREALEALVAHPKRLDGVRQQEVRTGDVLHANAVRLVRRDAGPLRRGQLLISSRVLSQIWALDPDSGAITWTLDGAFDGQHDPTLLDDDTLLMFDNGRQTSRALRMNLDGSEAGTWTRDGMFSRFCGAVQPLANGHLLVTESGPGRAMQVDVTGEVVWEFHTPFRAVDNAKLSATLFGVERLPASYGQEWLTPPGSAPTR